MITYCLMYVRYIVTVDQTDHTGITVASTMNEPANFHPLDLQEPLYDVVAHNPVTPRNT